MADKKLSNAKTTDDREDFQTSTRLVDANEVKTAKAADNIMQNDGTESAENSANKDAAAAMKEELKRKPADEPKSNILGQGGAAGL